MPPEYFRAGAGIVIVNGDGRVLVLERKQIPGAWQLPQGGLERGEEPLAAALREAQEETGISREDLVLLENEAVLLAYDLPVESRSEKTGRGQTNYWFIFRFTGDASSIDLAPGGEFRDQAWLWFEQLLERAVDFRKPVYIKLARHFQAHVTKR